MAVISCASYDIISLPQCLSHLNEQSMLEKSPSSRITSNAWVTGGALRAHVYLVNVLYTGPERNSEESEPPKQCINLVELIMPHTSCAMH